MSVCVCPFFVARKLWTWSNKHEHIYGMGSFHGGRASRASLISNFRRNSLLWLLWLLGLTWKKCNGNPLLNILRWYTVYLHMCEQKGSSKSLLSQKKSIFDDRISCLERGVEFLLVSPIGLWTYALNSINLMVVRAGRPANFLKKLLQWFTGLITFCLAAKASTWRSYHV